MSLIADAIMPDQIRLVFPGEPKHKQSTRISRGGFINRNTGKEQFAYQDPKVKAGEDAIAWTAVQQLPHGFIPWDCGICIIKALYVFPIPSSLTKKQKQFIEAGGIVYKSSKPDMDNIKKIYFDGLQGVVFKNDSRVCHIQDAMKIYGTNPRVEFILQPIR
jgi:Holliday junction resolvase RusA-like endonuclease